MKRTEKALEKQQKLENKANVNESQVVKNQQQEELKESKDASLIKKNPLPLVNVFELNKQIQKQNSGFVRAQSIPEQQSNQPVLMTANPRNFDRQAYISSQNQHSINTNSGKIERQPSAPENASGNDEFREFSKRRIVDSNQMSQIITATQGIKHNQKSNSDITESEFSRKFETNQGNLRITPEVKDHLDTIERQMSLIELNYRLPDRIRNGKNLNNILDIIAIPINYKGVKKEVGCIIAVKFLQFVMQNENGFVNELPQEHICHYNRSIINSVNRELQTKCIENLLLANSESATKNDNKTPAELNYKNVVKEVERQEVTSPSFFLRQKDEQSVNSEQNLTPYCNEVIQPSCKSSVNSTKLQK